MFINTTLKKKIALPLLLLSFCSTGYSKHGDYENIQVNDTIIRDTGVAHAKPHQEELQLDKADKFKQFMQEVQKEGERNYINQESTFRKKKENAEQKVRELTEQQRALFDQFETKRISKEKYDFELKLIDSNLAKANKALEGIDDEYKAFKQRAEKLGENLQGAMFKVFDVWNESNREEAKRETAIAVAATQAATQQDLANEGLMERLQFFMQPKILTAAGIGAVGVGAGLCAAYYLAKFGYAYLEATIGVPTLVRETNDIGLFQSMVAGIKSLFIERAQVPTKATENIVFAPALSEQINAFADETKKAKDSKLPYRNMLLYGPPGTGKTMIARQIARYTGMKYAIMSGADFSQFAAGKDIQQLHQMFDRAEMCEEGYLIFIDEADACFADRAKLDDRGIKLVNAFLSRTGANSDKFVVVLATNYPERLDKAVRSRVHMKINVPAPALDERIGMLALYLEQYFIKGNTNVEGNRVTLTADVDAGYLRDLAGRIDGFSGRAIEQMVGELRYALSRKQLNSITRNLFDEIANQKIAEFQAEKAMDASR